MGNFSIKPGTNNGKKWRIGYLVFSRYYIDYKSVASFLGGNIQKTNPEFSKIEQV